MASPDTIILFNCGLSHAVVGEAKTHVTLLCTPHTLTYRGVDPEEVGVLTSENMWRDQSYV